MQKLLLLDAYALIYRAYYAMIAAPRINSKGFNTSAVLGFVNTLEEILSSQKPTHIGVAFDPAGPTFRHEAYPAYKAQRESTPEDIRKSVPIIKEIIRAYRIPIVEVKGYEADDVIGTLATIADQRQINTYMVTPDKDYGQLVSPNVWQYRPGHGGYTLLGEKEITQKYGIEKTAQVIDILGLMGDASDNVPGCPGVGEKTATSLIQQFGSIEAIYENIDKVKGKLKEKLEANKEQVLFSKFLVTIKRDVPIELDMSLLEKEDCDKIALRKIFDELEFRNLIKKICGNEEQKPKSQIQQLDLFDAQPIDSREEIICENFSAESFEGKNYKLIDNQNDVKNVCNKILTNKIVGFSLATTTLNAIDAEIVGIAFASSAREAYFIPYNENFTSIDLFVKQFKEILESEDIEKAGYSFKFMQLVLARYGISLKGELFDTMLAHYVIQPELKHDLGYISEIYLHHTSMSLETYFGTKWNEERDMRIVPEEILTNFQCEQADICLRLIPRLKSELENYHEKELFKEIEMPLSNVLAKIEKNGVVIDQSALRETSKLFTERMKSYENEVNRISGETFNLSSPKQVGQILFEKMQLLEKPKKTKGGQYVTSEAVLEELRPSAPIVDYLLKYRGMKKLLSTYIDALPLLVNPRTGHIHTSFNQAVTSTGRLSSSNPNLQNIPVRGDDGKEIRKAFIPEAGCEFFSADYSQIELRVMAHLSGDKHLIEAFQNGQDIHAATAARVYHKAIEDISGDERRKAKTANFGIIYGITVFGLAQRIGISRGEAKELIDNYFATFPGVHNFMQSSIEDARSKGYIETIFHRRRYLPDINSQNAVVRGYAERNAINAPIQGSAADIIKVAMIRVDKAFERERLRSKMILQVHDELNFSVFPDEKQKVQDIVKYEMENACKLCVPLQADFGWGSNWLEAH